MKIKAFVQKYKRVLTAFLMALVPIACCIVTCAIDGKSVGDVYIPSSTWNDGLYYYKLVEAILEHGFPGGYYGYNESHALALSFGAWSPVLLLPWVIWGAIFGWSLMSPVICNIVLMSLAVFIFTYLVKPRKWQLVSLAAMLAVFTPMVRYMFSCMPEIICFFFMLVFLGLAISYCEKETKLKLVLMFVISAFVTLMRPYFILFVLLPGYYWFKKHKVAGVAGTLGIMGVTGVVYLTLDHFFAAEYFVDIFETEWVSKFFSDGIFEGIKYSLYKIFSVGKQFFAMFIESFISGLPAGALFVAYILLFVLVGVCAFTKWRKKDKDVSVYVLYTFCTFAMWMALLLMYNMTDGSKHLSAFIIMGIFLLSIIDEKYFWKWIVTTGLCAFLFIAMAKEPVNYDVPYKTAELEQDLNNLHEELEENMVFTKKTPSYENTLIWVFSDTVNGEDTMLYWQMLYAVPHEYGINLCYGDFVYENLDTLKSRYVATVPGGRIALALEESGAKVLSDNGKIMIYQRY